MPSSPRAAAADHRATDIGVSVAQAFVAGVYAYTVVEATPPISPPKLYTRLSLPTAPAGEYTAAGIAARTVQAFVDGSYCSSVSSVAVPDAPPKIHTRPSEVTPAPTP